MVDRVHASIITRSVLFSNRRKTPSPVSLAGEVQSIRASRESSIEYDRFCATTRSSSMATKKKSTTSKRTLIEPHKGDRRYVRRNKKGEFGKQVDVGRSLSADRRRTAKTKVKKGQGDRGDVKR